MDRSLTTQDLKKALGGNVHIYSYDQISKFRDIDELLSPYDRVIILYFWKVEPKCGHWVALQKTPRDTVELFDSFGTFEGQLKQIPKWFRNEHNQNYPYLTKLLYECQYEVEYNDKKLQSDTSSVCGRYCVARLATSDVPIELFQKMFTKDRQKNDELIIELTKEL